MRQERGRCVFWGHSRSFTVMMTEDHLMLEGRENTLLKIILNTLREHSRIEQSRSHRGPVRDIQTSPSILQENWLTDESPDALLCLGFLVP